MNQRYSSPLRTYPTSNLSHQFHSHLTPTTRSYSVCNRTIGPISGSFFCHLAKSVQADEASWSVSIFSVFPYDKGGALPNKDGNLYRFCKTCLKRDNDYSNVEDLQLSVEDAENRAKWRRRTRVADPLPEGSTA